jgi:hypothetical protein
MTRTLLAILLCAISTTLIWGEALRFFAAWSLDCGGDGSGWDTPLLTLFRSRGWNSDLFFTSLAPSLPFLLFCGPRQSRMRQWAMMLGMCALLAGVLYLSGPPTLTPEDSDSKGPFPDLGHLLVGVFGALPLALLMAWPTRRRSVTESPT